MSFYTGRYMRSHGSNWNGFPLRVGEPTLGDHLPKIGVRNVLVGKTHMEADVAGMERLGMARDSRFGVQESECGFEPFERDDGLHPTGRPRPPYDRICASTAITPPIRGSSGPTPARPRTGPAERLAARARRQARARRGRAFGDAVHDAARDGIHREAEGDGRPWCLHLSYIKPHWPYIAPEPYASMYGPTMCSR